MRPFFQALEKPSAVFPLFGNPLVLVLVLILALVRLPAPAAAPYPVEAVSLSPLLGPAETNALHAALARLNMTETDLSFARDVGEPRVTFDWIRGDLRDPLRFVARGDAVLAAFTGKDAAAWDGLRVLFETPSPPNVIMKDVELNAFPPELGETMSRLLLEFLSGARRADLLLGHAFRRLDATERRYLAAAELVGATDAGDRADARAALAAAGLGEAELARTLEESNALDPRPSADRFLDLAGRIDRRALLEAGRAFQQAVGAMREGLRDYGAWPAVTQTVMTDLGVILIGATNSDRFAGESLLVIAPPGPTRYLRGAGAANGLARPRLSAVLDLGGDDIYVGEGLVGPGAALFGVSVILDENGRDTHRAAWLGQGAGVFGVGWTDDRDGDDYYEAGVLGQGAGVWGVGVLRDRGGSDRYSAGKMAQGFAGVLGAGVLVDERGHDAYLAGGAAGDFDRHDDRFLSLAQGFSIGRRPFAGGGLGALVDLAGNDTYSADIFGQGASYWYAAGMLLDAGGGDRYALHQYGQGAGIHLSLGLLADGGGKDYYSAFSIAQGAAHDYAVGFLLDQGGDDTYTADDASQGVGINNSLAILADRAGDDAYFARNNELCQGIGHSGAERDYGCLSLLLDLAGADRYTCGATNGCRLMRPLYGLVYDLEEAPATP